MDGPPRVPGDSTYFLELAESYRTTGHNHKAIRLLQGILDSDPRCAPAFEVLATVLAAEGRDEDALACWERLLELEPDSDIARSRADALRPRIAARDEGRAHAAARRLWQEPATAEQGSNGRGTSGLREPTFVVDDSGTAAPRPEEEAGAAAVGEGASAPAAAPAAAEGEAGRHGAGEVGGAANGVSDVALRLADLLVGMLEFRDPYFRGSSSQTRLLAGSIARQLGLSEQAAREVELGAVLRDLGQQPVKALISQVGSGLSADAKRYVERHVDTALELLEPVGMPTAVLDAIRYHHERWDGSGYPDALSGEQIPLSARILAAADTFGAMIAARPHRLPQRVSSALDDMKKWAGSRYDPAVVDALVTVVERSGWGGPGFGLRQNLIIVDADETRAVTAAMRLCSAGYLAEAAFTAESALKRIQRSRVTRPAAFVISAELSTGEALDLLQQLRASPRAGTIPVVVTEAAAADRVAFLRAGADACLAAGAPFDEVVATLEALLRRNWSHDPTVTSGSPDNIWAGLQGDLEDFPLTWLLQVLHYDGRTAGVFIVGKEDEGAIYLDRGNPRFAQTRNLTGEAAFRAMLKWAAGSFTVDPDARIDDQTISTPLMNLLLEQAVVDDHSAFFDPARSGL